MDIQELRSLRGQSTAYFIDSENKESDNGNGYLLAFPIDRKMGETKRYIVEPATK